MRLSEHRNLLWLALAAALLGSAVCALAVYIFREAIFPLPPLAEIREGVYSLLNTIPAPLYFLALVILPAFGVPLTLFYLTALPVLGHGNAFYGVMLTWVAIALNMAFTNLLTHGVFRPIIERLIRHRNMKIPRIRKENEWKIVLATRISPAPWALQNYLLALGHSRWRYYLWFSLPIQGGIGLAMMLLGESVLKGGFGYVLLAIFLIFVVNLLLQNFRKRLSRESVQPEI
ncbi:hypothetical protein G0Q06_08275 [Puniceicoccales bacterium CK1056]|uniref:TVP38/TMEM64 family membrane protein n=1 Tax=Oceanipulchritudo coccoides TaxID=2706888 RepID=A0A6B2M285_9BACT|nr:hypothetical protein [Oceanipulchritudo coccoides]NDV62442.1 hypothetical protein [Oceanipulchritudo coccoides]